MSYLAAANPETAELVFVIAFVVAAVSVVYCCFTNAWALALISAALFFGFLGLYLL